MTKVGPPIGTEKNKKDYSKVKTMELVKICVKIVIKLQLLGTGTYQLGMRWILI